MLNQRNVSFGFFCCPFVLFHDKLLFSSDGSKGLRVVVSQKVRSFVDRFNNTLNSRLSPSDRAVSKQFTDSLTMQIIKVCCNSMQSALDESKTNKQPIPDVEQFIRHTIMEFVGSSFLIYIFFSKYAHDQLTLTRWNDTNQIQ